MTIPIKTFLEQGINNTNDRVGANYIKVTQAPINHSPGPLIGHSVVAFPYSSAFRQGRQEVEYAVELCPIVPFLSPGRDGVST